MFDRIIAILLLLTSVALSADEIRYESNGSPGWIAKGEIAAVGGQFIGQNQSYGEIGVLLAPYPSGEWFYFSDIHAFWLERNKFASNLGLGVRKLDSDSGRILGANIYYDYFEKGRGGLNRLGFGLESLGECVDFRINAYLPLTNSINSTKRVYLYEGGYIASSRKKYYSFNGIDAEVGGPLWRFCDWDLYGAVGPYYYDGKRVSQIYGAQGRLTLSLMDCLTIEGRFSSDNHYHTQAQGRIALSIPLEALFCGCSFEDCCTRQFTREVERNRLPFFEHCCSWHTNWQNVN